MPVQVQPFPEFGVTVNVYSGTLDREGLGRFIDRLNPADATGRWINYLDPSVDISGLDVADLPWARRAFAAKLRELQGERRVKSALVVSTSSANEDFKTFWPSYVDHDPQYPAEVAAFLTLEAACRWLDLPDAARCAVIQSVEGFKGTAAGRPPTIGAAWGAG